MLSLLIVWSIGILIPAQVTYSARTLYRWPQAVSYEIDTTDDDYVSEAELEAMLWLREHSGSRDVTVTNVHCRPAENVPGCDARGFWVVGLSGRRSVLEGWAYTSEAQSLQGADDRSYSRQPAPFPERARLTEAVFESADLGALRELRLRHDAQWIVGVRRAGPVPTFPASVASVRFDNGEVVILELQTSDDS